ncbi:MAG: hypothetical protein GXO10_07070 [Crenarchaeota archaeon]|nr:hypothetical protein [Thermoproteota archaeon]
MTKLKIKEKNLKLKTVEPDEFIKFMIKYQKTPIKVKKTKTKKHMRISKQEKGKKGEIKPRFKISFNIKIFKRSKR